MVSTRYRLGGAMLCKVLGLGIAGTIAMSAAVPLTAWASEADALTSGTNVEVVCVAEEQPQAVIDDVESTQEVVSTVAEPDAVVPQVTVGGDEDVAAGDTVSAPVVDNAPAEDVAEEVATSEDTAADATVATVANGAKAAVVAGDADVTADDSDDAETTSMAEAEEESSDEPDNPDDPDDPDDPDEPEDPSPSEEEVKASLTNIYRLYNAYTGEHFYTANLSEAVNVATAGWRWEGPAFTGSTSFGDAVYRLYNVNGGLHHYTIFSDERDMLSSLGWRVEGIGWYANGDDSLYRLYNHNDGNHHYTASSSEATFLVEKGWKLESSSAWGVGSTTFVLDSGEWLTTSAWGSQQLYWIAQNGHIAKGRYVEKSEGAGWRAYAKSDGAIVRGVYVVSDTQALVANDKGALLQGNGMVVTGDFSNGVKQRYYLENGYARLGEFTYAGNKYFGRSDTGYVVRGDYFYSKTGTMYRGDNDGILQTRNSKKDSYVDWALAIAKDDSHGYSQIWRDGPDYDCSSLVIHALQHAGYRTGYATYTGNMYSELSKYGWRSYSLSNTALQYGDILLNDAYHTAIYLANGWLVQASSDENHSWQGYKSGDQTGKEIWYRTYYNYPWTRILRHA